MGSHSYQFAHRDLPSAFFHEPQGFMAALSGAGGPKVIRDLWEAQGNGSDAPTLVVHETPDAGSVAIVEMPHPEAAGEAHLVALIVRDGQAGPRWARYFTLERAIDLLDEGRDMTMLCEWDPSGRHINHGEGPSPSTEAFLEAAFGTLIAEAKRSASS